MGTINNGLFAGVRRTRIIGTNGEKPFLEGGKTSYLENSFGNIETIMTRSRPSTACRSSSNATTRAPLQSRLHVQSRPHDGPELYEGPLFLQLVLGVLGGVGAEIDSLLAMARTAQRLFSADLEWSALAAGRHQMPMCVHNAPMGGNVRVGLEDSLNIGRGELARSNTDQVRRIRRILGELGDVIATPDEARERLALNARARFVSETRSSAAQLAPFGGVKVLADHAPQ